MGDGRVGVQSIGVSMLFVAANIYRYIGNLGPPCSHRREV